MTLRDCKGCGKRYLRRSRNITLCDECRREIKSKNMLIANRKRMVNRRTGLIKELAEIDEKLKGD